MENSSSNWQNSLNDSLVNRLTRPLLQPGMMKMAMSQSIINRCDRFLNRLPLLSQQMQRWGNTNTLSSSVPIVYAQPVSLAQDIKSQGKIFQLNTPQNQPPLIQRKLDASQSVPIQASNNTLPIQNPTNLSTYNFGDETRKSPIETRINQHISSSESPIVSPQSLSPELRNNGEMPLQAKFTDSKTSLQPNINILSTPTLNTGINKTSISSSESPIVSPRFLSPELRQNGEMPLQAKFTDSTTSSSLNIHIPSTPTLDTGINKTSTSSSPIPVVSPQSLSPKLQKSGEMPLQAKFTDSKTSSQPNINILSTPTLNTGINKTFISSSESPIVFPSQELLKTEEMPLVQEYASICDEPLPIIQAKLLNSSLSASSVPVVNNLNSLVYLKQIQQNNSEDLVSSKQENLTSQVYSTSFPIVTAKPLTSKFNSLNKEISFSINPSHSPNQPLSTVKTQPVNILNSQIHQNNHQNISSLPLISVTSAINPHSNPQSSLPLAKTSSSSQNTNHQPNRNITSNQNSLSSSKSFVSPLSATETSVSAMKTQSNTQQNIDVDSIASQVERKLMRRLVIESERRGKIR